MYFRTVKKLLRISALTAISALYCFFISIYCSLALNAGIVFSNSTYQAFYPSSAPSSSFYHTERAESSVSTRHNIPRTTFKNPFNQFSAYCATAVQTFNNSYSPYIYFSENLFIRFKNTEIIFPFHNFW